MHRDVKRVASTAARPTVLCSQLLGALGDKVIHAPDGRALTRPSHRVDPQGQVEPVHKADVVEVDAPK